MTPASHAGGRGFDPLFPYAFYFLLAQILLDEGIDSDGGGEVDWKKDIEECALPALSLSVLANHLVSRLLCLSFVTLALVNVL